MKIIYTGTRCIFILVIVLSCSQSHKQTESLPDKADIKGKAASGLESRDSLDHQKSNVDKKPSTDITALSARQILSGKVRASIPQAFKVMTPQMIAIKYPTKVGMEYDAYTNQDGNINIAFEHMPNQGGEKDLPELQSVMSSQFGQPNIKVLRNEIIKINGKDFMVLEMITPAPDGPIYNLMFVTSLNNRYLMGNFNCTIDYQKEWQPIANEILQSIEVKGM